MKRNKVCNILFSPILDNAIFESYFDFLTGKNRLDANNLQITFKFVMNDTFWDDI